PLLLLWKASIPSEDSTWWLVVPLLASAYGFCQVAIKTDDGYFLGFPSYWNVVAFYLYALRPDAWISTALLLVLSVLTFVPSRYLYPSQSGRINRLTIILGAAWCCLLVYLLWRMPEDEMALSRWSDHHFSSSVVVSLFFPVYYIVTSWGISFRIHRARVKSI